MAFSSVLSLDPQKSIKVELAIALNQLEKGTFQYVRSHRRAHVPDDLLNSLEQSGDFDRDELSLLYQVQAAEEQQGKQILEKLRQQAKHLRECLNRRKSIMSTMWEKNLLTKEVTEAWLQRQFILERQLKNIEFSLGAFQ